MHATRQMGATYDEILSQHRELRGMTRALRAFCERPRPEVGSDGGSDWANGLSQQLVRFHDQVFRHFREEERSGLLGELGRSRPTFARSAAALEAQHQSLLSDIRALLHAAMQYSADKAPDSPNLRQQLIAVLDGLEQHEHEETDLIQRFMSEDLGAGD